MENQKHFPTDIPDVNREILLQLKINEIEQAISAYPELEDEINDWFWQRLFIRDFIDLGSGIDYKELYYQIKDMGDDDLLIFAAKNGYTNLVAFVLDRGGIDFDETAVADDAFIIAAENGHLSVVKLFTEHGISFNDALNIAAEKGHLPIIKYFVDLGVAMEEELTVAALYAASKGQIDIIAYLLDAGVDIHYDDEEILSAALRSGNLDMVKFLLEHGADIGSLENHALNYATSSNNVSLVKYLLEKYTFTEIDIQLLDAISSEVSPAIIKVLLDNGASVNAYDGSPLINAAENSRKITNAIEIIKLLLDRGANIHAQTDEALYSAISVNNIPIVEELLKHGANVHAREDDMIEKAITNGYTDMVKLLMKYGATIKLSELLNINKDEYNKKAIDYVLSVLEKQQSNIPVKKQQSNIPAKTQSAHQCLGITKQGTQCKRKAASGEKYCNLHKS